MSDLKITICIFSFNRGKFLKNCVESIVKCVPRANIAVFDDNSTDQDTIEYLKTISENHRVVKPKELGTIKHGGLYHNMNLALDIFKEEPLLCFLQDDTQLIRPILDGELEEIHDLLNVDAKLGFVHPCFIRGMDLKKRPVNPMKGPSTHFFFREDMGQSAGIYYSDLVIFTPQKLIAAGWSFQQSEPANNQQAKQYFGMMVYMWLPFAMWLPEVPTYRGKKKTLGLKWAEAKKNVGFYPFNVWSTEDVQERLNTSNFALPVAEDFLSCVERTPKKPWTYNPLSGLRWLKHLNNFELALRKLFSR